MKKVQLLDCTLRDGGYVNDWDFGHSVIVGTYKRLDASGVEFIEVGFLDDRREFDINKTIQPSTKCFDVVFEKVEKQTAVPVAMIDYGTCSLDNIADAKDSFIKGIRVIFKKEKIDEALPYCEAIKKKGYKLFIQAISITSYSDMEMLEYIQKINQIKPYAFSIVDTYGLLDNKKLDNYFRLMDNNLLPTIKIGYHAHNNFQLGFSNSVRFLAQETEREIVTDSTVYGMGKSAGNCPSELIAMHMNEKYGKQYDINQFLEIFDTDLALIYEKFYWGYKYNFFISAMQNCHPNYVQFLLDKKTLSVSSINEILSTIPNEIRLLYDKEFITKAYLSYQSNCINDEKDVLEMAAAIQGKCVLLVGPGGSIVAEEKKISDFISDNQPVVISVNFEYEKIKSDFVFLSNAKRYGKLADVTQVQSLAKLIVTSNITAYDRKADYRLNYESLTSVYGGVSDSALLLVLAALMKMNVKEVYLAGFDGFTQGDNYYEDKYAFVGNKRYSIDSNQTMISALQSIKDKIRIRFITKSLYEN